MSSSSQVAPAGSNNEEKLDEEEVDIFCEEYICVGRWCVAGGCFDDGGCARCIIGGKDLKRRNCRYWIGYLFLFFVVNLIIVIGRELLVLVGRLNDDDDSNNN